MNDSLTRRIPPAGKAIEHQEDCAAETALVADEVRLRATEEARLDVAHICRADSVVAC